VKLEKGLCYQQIFFPPHRLPSSALRGSPDTTGLSLKAQKVDSWIRARGGMARGVQGGSNMAPGLSDALERPGIPLEIRPLSGRVSIRPKIIIDSHPTV
jgi:hypothetical protein